MPHATASDGVKLYYEETGSGDTVIFVHEFAGDHCSWEPQLRYFARRYRCVAYNARGYPPSDVPESFEQYSQALARDDVIAVLDQLKVDRSFVRDVTSNEDDAEITRAIIGMAHGLGLKVIAEGVEHEDQLKFLRWQKCDNMQGYYFSRPLQAEAFEALLTSGKILKN